VIQWSADVTEHAHIEQIKVPARAGNNQNYYSQIARHLDRLDKCFHFDLATYIAEHANKEEDGDKDDSDLGEDEEDGPDTERRYLSEYSTPTRQIPNYFALSSALLLGAKPSAPKPYRMFATSTTSFHLATKPSSRSSVNEAATAYHLPDLADAIAAFFRNGDALVQGQPRTDKLQIWHKVRVQQVSYHNSETVLPPQTLRAIPPSTANRFGRYDSVIISPGAQSDWPQNGLAGHSVAQLWMIFRDLRSDSFFAYVHHFKIVPQSNSTNINSATGMYMLKRAVRGNGERIGEVIPLIRVRSLAHLIPNFGHEAHSRLTNLSSYELSSEFWLNKFWSKEFYHALSP